MARRRRCEPTRGAVDELIEDHEITGMDVGAKGARRAGRHDAFDAGLTHRPEVGPEVDDVGRELVVAAVTGKERDRAAADVADGEGRAGRTVGGVDNDLFDVVEEVVDPRTSEDPDVGGGHRHSGRQALLASAFELRDVPELFDDFESLEEALDEESDFESFESFESLLVERSDESEPEDFFDEPRLSVR